MIGYLSIATPHKLALTKHFGPEDKDKYIWHSRVKDLMLSGSIKHAYYLLTSYYGYWFLPRFLLDIAKSKLLKGRKGLLLVLSYFVDLILFVNANSTFNFLKRVFVVFWHDGFKSTIKKILLKLFQKAEYSSNTVARCFYHKMKSIERQLLN